MSTLRACRVNITTTTTQKNYPIIIFDNILQKKASSIASPYVPSTSTRQTQGHFPQKRERERTLLHPDVNGNIYQATGWEIKRSFVKENVCPSHSSPSSSSSSSFSALVGKSPLSPSQEGRRIFLHATKTKLLLDLTSVAATTNLL